MIATLPLKTRTCPATVSAIQAGERSTWGDWSEQSAMQAWVSRSHWSPCFGILDVYDDHASEHEPSNSVSHATCGLIFPVLLRGVPVQGHAQA